MSACALHDIEFCLHPECAPKFHSAMRHPWTPPREDDLNAANAERAKEDDAEHDAAMAALDNDPTRYEQEKFRQDVRSLGPEKAAERAANREAWRSRSAHRKAAGK